MFKKILSQDQTLNLVQSNIETALIRIQKSPFATGQMVSLTTRVNNQTTTTQKLTLTAGQDNLVAHNLGAPPNYWIITRMLPTSNAAADVWEFPTATLADVNGVSQSTSKLYLNLRCSANCTISLWVST